MTRARTYQSLDFGERADPTSRAEDGAIQGRGGAGEIQHAGQPPALKHGVDEGAVEDVARTGGVHGVDAEGRRVVEMGTVKGKHSTNAER